MFDAAARALGCVVVPAGVGQQDLQIRVARAVGATGYTGLPSYLLALLDRAAAAGTPLPLRRAVVTGEPLPEALRARIEAHGVTVHQAYGTADVGLIGYECGRAPGCTSTTGSSSRSATRTAGRCPRGGGGGRRHGPAGDLSAHPVRHGRPERAGGGALPLRPPVARLKGWMGRVSEVTKVRGIFLYPKQLEAAMAGWPAAWSAGVRWWSGTRTTGTCCASSSPGRRIPGPCGTPSGRLCG